MENYTFAKYEEELFFSGETKLVLPKEVKDYIDKALRYIYKLSYDDVKKILEFIGTCIKNMDKYNTKLEKLVKEQDYSDDKNIDYLDQSKYAVEYLEDCYERFMEYKNWKVIQ
jgi:hypothetical protein